jgi:putative tryptophan/tyrosine transport system substrate-binding protein
MRRRDFMALMGGAAVGWPLKSFAQQANRIPKVGVLWHAGNEREEALFLGALREGFAKLGYMEGRNIELVNRFADEHYERFDALANDLVRAKVDVIVASVPLAASAAKRATTTIPIVFATAADPVGTHLVESLAHPGTNVTGMSNATVDLAAKHLELLKDCQIELSGVGLLSNPRAPHSGQYISVTQKAADSIGVILQVVEADSPEKVVEAFSALNRARVNAVVVMSDPMFYNERRQLAQMGLDYKLPILAWTGGFTEAGVLMSYGANIVDLFRRTPILVDKIIKGKNRQNSRCSYLFSTNCS